eukprot:CAMPEP_0184971884 /NCGR_PEP_ID=MMETSP1098-20130426/4014_1 /TAXON_ID=89044 /ORGANISM="Spumella elongata, Strain CCAP 955/1" /LENGTH=536 /DNA_ID=CAMNT_0027494081 /DNA_START=309 /DNA_END=1919 /DNA_ORIENTATION=+
MAMQKGEDTTKDALKAPSKKPIVDAKVEEKVVAAKESSDEQKKSGSDAVQQNVAPVAETVEAKAQPVQAETSAETVDVKAVVETVEEAEKEVADAESAAAKEEVKPAAPAPVPTAPVVAVETVAEPTPLPNISAGVTIPVMPSEELAKATDSKVLKQAIADSSREFIALRRDVESTLLKDIHQLDEHGLRIRIKQLATEMFERLAWEDLRMAQSLKGVQSELSSKYTDLMSRQRQELELEVKKLLFQYEQDSTAKSASKLREIEATYQKQLEDTIRAQAEGFHATLKKELEEQSKRIHTELQDDLNHQVAILRKDQVKELLELQPQISSVVSQLGAVKIATDRTAAAIKQTIDIHQLSAAVLSLEMALSSTTHYEDDDNFIAHHFAEVRKACQGDEVVKVVLDTLPARVVSSGALQLPDLQVRFAVMREEVRKTALTPEAAPKLIGHLIGSALAAISVAPSGLVPGNGSEEALSRAAYYLERGRIAESLKELQAVQGYGQVQMRDWISLAQERLVVDQAIRVLKANAVIRHKAFTK